MGHMSPREALSSGSSVAAAGVVSVFLRVNASAILLAVETHGLGSLDPFLPSDSIVLVEKCDAVMLPQFFSHFADQFMVLVAGIEQACRESLES